MSARQRDPLDWLLLRAPAVGTAISTGTVRLKLGSPLRRGLIYAQVRRGFHAMARSDIDLNVLIYEPDTEVWMHGMDGDGIGGCFRGREGVRALYREIDERGKIARQEWMVEQDAWQRVLEASGLRE